MITYLWSILFIIGIIYSFITKTNISNIMLSSSHESIDLILSIIPVTCLWLGIMKIADDSGLLNKIAKYLFKYLKYIFPELKNDYEALSYIAINIIMNILGLGNAATPFGLKAMTELQKINKNKDTASRSMITFLIINTSSVTIIPTTVISLRILYNSINPMEIIPYVIITSSLSCLIGLILDRTLYLCTRRKYDISI